MSVISETKHLGPDTECPPQKPGTLRLYSMKFCPYAERPRLVLAAKNVEYEVVNVNLKQKPDWYLAKHSSGKVPCLERDDKFIPESLIVCDLLDELYPEPALYPADPWQKAKDRAMIDQFGAVAGTMYQMYGARGDAAKIKELSQAFDAKIQPFNDELARRGTPFFHGERPGMLDLMIWPWMERFPAFLEVLRALLPRPPPALVPPSSDRLSGWMERMAADPHVKACLTSTEKHVDYLVTHKTGIVEKSQAFAD